MGHSKNKVGVIQFTVLTIVSMTDGIIMIPTLAAGVGAISLYAWVTTTLGAVILAYAFAKCGQFNKKQVVLGDMQSMVLVRREIFWPIILMLFH